MKRTPIQATSEAKRWEGYARAKGFQKSGLIAFERRDCSIMFKNGAWVLTENGIAAKTETARHDMLIAALKAVH